MFIVRAAGCRREGGAMLCKISTHACQYGVRYTYTESVWVRERERGRGLVEHVD